MKCFQSITFIFRRSPKSDKKSRKKREKSQSSSSGSDDDQVFSKDLLEKLEKERLRSFMERKTYKEQVKLSFLSMFQ